MQILMIFNIQRINLQEISSAKFRIELFFNT